MRFALILENDEAVRIYSIRPTTDRRSAWLDGTLDPDAFKVGVRANYRYMFEHPPPLPAPAPAVSAQDDSPGRSYNDWYNDLMGRLGCGGVNEATNWPIEHKSESEESARDQHITAAGPQPDPATDGHEESPVYHSPNYDVPHPESRGPSNAGLGDPQWGSVSYRECPRAGHLGRYMGDAPDEKSLEASIPRRPNTT